MCITFETVQDIQNINCHKKKKKKTIGKILVSPLVKQGGRVQTWGNQYKRRSCRNENF